jgi:hypothetical protein
MQMDEDAMDASRCMPPIHFGDHQASQGMDVVRIDYTLCSHLRAVFLIATLPSLGGSAIHNYEQKYGDA